MRRQQPRGTQWEAFFETAADTSVSAFIDRYEDASVPADRALTIDWHTLTQHNDSLATDVLQAPAEHVCREFGTTSQPAAIAGLTSLSAGSSQLPAARVRVANLPDSETYDVGELRTRHLDRLVAVQGEVTATEPVEPLLTMGVFVCHRCGAEHELPRQEYGDLIEPYECENCERQGPFTLNRDRSTLVDFQELTLIPADTNRNDPPTLPVYLRADLCDRVGTHDIVTVVGVYDTLPMQLQQDSRLSVYIEANNIDQQAETRVDRLDRSELRDEVRDYVARTQDADDTFNVKRDTIVAAFEERGVRATEVQDVLDDLVDDGELLDGGAGLMVA
jgi:replicative DNA helicase Mcm